MFYNHRARFDTTQLVVALIMLILKLSRDKKFLMEKLLNVAVRPSFFIFCFTDFFFFATS